MMVFRYPAKSREILRGWDAEYPRNGCKATGHRPGHRGWRERPGLALEPQGVERIIAKMEGRAMAGMAEMAELAELADIIKHKEWRAKSAIPRNQRD